MLKKLRAHRSAESQAPHPTILPDFADPILENGLDHNMLLMDMGISITSEGLLRRAVIAIAEAHRVTTLNGRGRLGEVTKDPATLLEQAKAVIEERALELANAREILGECRGNQGHAILVGLHLIDSFVHEQYAPEDDVALPAPVSVEKRAPAMRSSA